MALDPAALAQLVARMRNAGLPARLIEVFSASYERFRAGETGFFAWPDVQPPAAEDLVAFEQLTAEHARLGERSLDQLVCIKVNGGLGTTMKLARAKSLIPVRDGRSFLRLSAEQVARLRARYGCRTPLLLMNSFNTHDDSLAELRDQLPPSTLPPAFLQHRVPRIVADTGRPLALAGDDERNWAPPGHGDIYLALQLSGVLQQLLDQGFRWAFVSNVDNLAATVEPAVLGYLEQQQREFAMELTAKSAADRKGGTLVRYRGRLTLLERSQVPAEGVAEFESATSLPWFNTNNLWWRLDALQRRLEAGLPELPLIVNRKRSEGVEFVQLETAMGAAVGWFDSAVGLLVPRARFAPVKHTADLAAVRSDAWCLDDAGALRPDPQRDPHLGPPLIELDPRYFEGLAEFEQRLPAPLRLRRCHKLRVSGDVRFGREVEIVGDVALQAAGAGQSVVADGTRFASGSYVL